MVKYEEFKTFYDKHPDLDNAEYYAEFPETNKSTIRSWKLRSKPVEEEIEPPKETKNNDYTELENEHIKMLINQTNTDIKELEGLDNKSKLVVLRNRVQVLSENKGKGRAANSSILPAPRPESITHKKFGIDEYITFDEARDEIRMEIPADVLFDPEKNKGLGLIK